VVLADDHDIPRQGLKMLHRLQPQTQVVGEARTGREAPGLAQALCPDIVVLDITMPDMDGLEACRQNRQRMPTTQVLILTMHSSICS
jgi:DNA-binding NarL/FixJ family response regulator